MINPGALRVAAALVPKLPRYAPDDPPPPKGHKTPVPGRVSSDGGATPLPFGGGRDISRAALAGPSSLPKRPETDFTLSALDSFDPIFPSAAGIGLGPRVPGPPKKALSEMGSMAKKRGSGLRGGLGPAFSTPIGEGDESGFRKSSTSLDDLATVPGFTTPLGPPPPKRRKPVVARALLTAALWRALHSGVRCCAEASAAGVLRVRFRPHLNVHNLAPPPLRSSQCPFSINRR